MKTFYDQVSSTTSASSNENIRFKSTFIKLVDDITSMTKNPERNFSSTFSTPNKKYSTCKINSYKLNLLIKKESTDLHPTPGLYSPGNKNVNLYFDKMKLDGSLKTKYKNILENGLISIKTGQYDKYHITESKIHF